MASRLPEDMTILVLSIVTGGTRGGEINPP